MIEITEVKTNDESVKKGDFVMVNEALCLFVQVSRNTYNFIDVKHGNRYFDEFPLPYKEEPDESISLEDLRNKFESTFEIVKKVAFSFTRE